MPSRRSDESFEMQEVTWGLLEALMWDETGKEDEIISIHHALDDLNGSAFGAGARRDGYESDVDIPHFPPLSEAMLMEEPDAPRTSGQSHTRLPVLMFRADRPSGQAEGSAARVVVGQEDVHRSFR